MHYKNGEMTMELITAYLYNRIPIEMNNISNRTFHQLKRNGWYTNLRTNQKYTMLDKRIEVNDQWYRAMIRFEHKGLIDTGEESFLLSFPCPFIVTECEKLTMDRWKDTKAYHGPKLGSVSGFVQSGVPEKVIQQVHEDLQLYITYNE